MAKGKRPYSSFGLDTELLNDPSFLKSDAMKRIEEEQAGSPVTAAEQAPQNQSAQAEVDSLPEVPVNEPKKEITLPSAAKTQSSIQEIFTRGSMHDKDFSSMVLHHDILEDLHELARVRDGEGRRYPVKYLATNIIKSYLRDHKDEIEKVKKEFRMRRG